MIRFRLPFIALAAIAAVAGCDQRDPVANDANANGALPQPVNEASPNPEALPPTNAAEPEAANAVSPAASGIPAALHGRWGMSPGDCTSTRGDAKGLLTISREEMRFYESVAVPAEGAEAAANSISGTFSFTGEGQTWSRYQSLQLKGQELVRTETNPTASYTYAKCK